MHVLEDILQIWNILLVLWETSANFMVKNTKFNDYVFGAKINFMFNWKNEH